MTKIVLTTIINAHITKVFDLSRDIDFHVISTSKTNEKAISGKTSGKINLGEIVQWRGKHFGIFLRHTSKITVYKKPVLFIDEMIRGNFRTFVHTHKFKDNHNHTVMTDYLEYTVPYHFIGNLFNQLFLKRHLTNFLIHRNYILKKSLEA